MSINKEKIKAINVVVIGGIHHNTLGVIRSLGEGGIGKDRIYTLLIGKYTGKPNIIASSRYILEKNVIYAESHDSILEWLQSLSKDKKKRVIICCSDEASEVIISNTEKLSKYYYTPSSTIDIKQLMKKDVQDSLATSCGLLTPDSIVITPGNYYEWDQYPCILKPLKSVIGAGKNDIRIALTENDLNTMLGTIKAQYVQIQSFISKQFEYQLIGCSLNGGNTIIIPGYTNILRQPSNTNTGYLEYIPINKLSYDSKSVQNFIKKIGYSGLFSMEFIRDKSETDYFLEINMRNDGNAYCVKSAGINLPLIWCYYCVYGEFPNVPVSFDKVIHFIPDFNDLKVALAQRCFARWLIDFFTSNSHSIYNKKDIKPFWIETINQVKKQLLEKNNINRL